MSKDISIRKSKSDDFRKTDTSGRGYQPMVYGLKSAQITEEKSIGSLSFPISKGLRKEFIYRVEKNIRMNKNNMNFSFLR